MRKITFILALLVMSVSIQYGYSQKKHAVISVYTAKMDGEDDKTMEALAKFIDDDKTYLKVIESKLPQLIEKLNSMIAVESSDNFIGESYYKFLLDEYEPAPENVPFTITGLSTSPNEDLVLKTDYRMSEHQVMTVGDYLAIGTGRPFNNDDATKLLIDKLSSIDGFIILEFSPSLSFSGSEWGVGNSGASFSLRTKIVNRKNKVMFKNTINAGSTGVKFEVKGTEQPDMAQVRTSFEKSFDNLIGKLDKMSKKLAKMKY